MNLSQKYLKNVALICGNIFLWKLLVWAIKAVLDSCMHTWSFKCLFVEGKWQLVFGVYFHKKMEKTCLNPKENPRWDRLLVAFVNVTVPAEESRSLINRVLGKLGWTYLQQGLCAEVPPHKIRITKPPCPSWLMALQCVWYYIRNAILLLRTSLYRPYSSEVHLSNQHYLHIGPPVKWSQGNLQDFSLWLNANFFPSLVHHLYEDTAAERVSKNQLFTKRYRADNGHWVRLWSIF